MVDFRIVVFSLCFGWSIFSLASSIYSDIVASLVLFVCLSSS